MSTRQSSIEDFTSMIVISPLRPTAKISARLPSGNGSSSSTEWPAWRISRQAPRHTARVTSGRACRATDSMLMVGLAVGGSPRRVGAGRPVVDRVLERRRKALRQRLGALAVSFGNLLRGLFADDAGIHVATLLGKHQPLVALDRIARAGDAADQHDAERVLGLRQSLLCGAAVPQQSLRGIARNADAGEVGIGELELRRWHAAIGGDLVPTQRRLDDLLVGCLVARGRGARRHVAQGKGGFWYAAFLRLHQPALSGNGIAFDAVAFTQRQAIAQSGKGMAFLGGPAI